ncbi:MAG: DUF3127 domain-containing protein [Muribaculum sp.]|nr:DUF3127 domain-containing protein [Muribaculum sp.]
MEIEGKIIFDLPRQEGVSKAGNPWKKKEWVLETINTQFPRKVKFHVFGDRADQLLFEIGKDYAISVDVESREFNGRWYTDVSCYAMRPIEASAAQNNFQQTSMPQGAPAATGNTPNFGPAQQMPPFGAPAAEDTDDLPF